jgi:hypothetical protein
MVEAGILEEWWLNLIPGNCGQMAVTPTPFPSSILPHFGQWGNELLHNPSYFLVNPGEFYFVNLCIFLVPFKIRRWVWLRTPVLPVLRRLRQEVQEFEVSLGSLVRQCLKNKTK